MKSPSFTVWPPTLELLRSFVDVELAGADDRRLAHLAADHRGVRGHAAGRGQDALRDEHAVDVVGHRLAAHQNHRLALVRPFDRVVGREDDLAAGRAGRRRQPPGRDRNLLPLGRIEPGRDRAARRRPSDPRAWAGTRAAADRWSGWSPASPCIALEHAVEVVALQRQQLVRAPCGGRLRCRPGSSAGRSGCAPRRRTCARCGTGRCRARRTRRRAPPDPAGRRWRGCPGAGTCRPTTAACRSAGRCPTSSRRACLFTTCRISLGFDATRAELHFAGQAVERDEVAFLHRLAADAELLRVLVDLELAGADDRRLAHLAADHRGVRGHAAGRGEDALRRRTCRGCRRAPSRGGPGSPACPGSTHSTA